MQLIELKQLKPTQRWKASMEDGDDLFTNTNITACEMALDKFIDNLISLGENPREEQILNSVKDVVISLNEIDEEYDNFIETVEREELCDFIIKAVNVAGLETEEDVTEEWREW